MQEDHRGTSKTSGCIRRVHNETTETRAAFSSRMTMMPGDITQMQKSSKEKIAAKRQSVMPLQLSLEAQRKADVERKEIEFELLYDEYLQAMAMDFTIRKKIERKRKLMVTQMAVIAQEIEQDMEKLIKIKERERDIISLSLAQREIDAQVTAVKKYTNNDTFNILKRMIGQLQCLFEPLDMLKCNDIILPTTKKEWQQTEDILKQCSSVLKNMANLVRSKGETYCSVNGELREYSEIYKQVEDLQKQLKEILCKVQVMILKEASLSLM